MQSRFPTRIHIDDYTIVELCEISKRYAATKSVRYHRKLLPKLLKYVEYLIDEGLNARDMIRRTDAALAKRTNRLFLNGNSSNSKLKLSSTNSTNSTNSTSSTSVSSSKASKTTLELTADDFGIGNELGESKEKKDLIDKELDKLIGMKEAKEMFQEYKDIVTAVESGIQSRSALKVCMNLVITGNPGTGTFRKFSLHIDTGKMATVYFGVVNSDFFIVHFFSLFLFFYCNFLFIFNFIFFFFLFFYLKTLSGKTSFAKLLHQFMYTYGVLRKDNFVMINGTSLKGAYVGQSGPKVRAIIQQAMGGTLFIDEAYNLSNQTAGSETDQYARDVIGTLLTEIENNRTGIMVIMGGYKDKMARLMRFDPGLQRRFPKRLHLPDYTALELAQICESYANHKFEKIFADDLTLQELEKYLITFHSTKMSKFNAGLAVEMVEAAVQSQTARIGRSTRLINQEQMKRKEEIRLELGNNNSDSEEEDRDDTSRSTSTTTSLSIATLRQTSITTVQAIQAKKELALEACILTPEDFSIHAGGPKIGDDELIKEVEIEINNMVGLEEIKSFMARLKKTVQYVERGGNPRILKQNLNLVLTGNPGTGTVAALILDFLSLFFLVGV